MPKKVFYLRFVASLLILFLSLGSYPAYALRPVATQESSEVEELKGRLQTTSPAAGLEEVLQPVEFFDEIAPGLPGWVESHQETGWPTNSPIFGEVRARFRTINDGRTHRFIISAEEEWSRPLREQLGSLWDGQFHTNLFKPPLGAFGQIRVATYHVRGRPALLIEEVQPGDGYRRLSQSQREQLNSWRRQVIQALLDWAESMNIPVYGTPPDAIRQIYDRVRQNPQTKEWFPLSETEAQTNYGPEAFDPQLWELQEMTIRHWMSGAVHGRRLWYAYRENAEIENRRRALSPEARVEEATARLFSANVQQRERYLSQLINQLIRPLVRAGERERLEQYIPVLCRIACLQQDPAATHSSPELRERASWVLGLIGRPTPQVLEAFRVALVDPDPARRDSASQVREAILDDLIALRPETQEGFNGISSLLEQVRALYPETSPEVRAASAASSELRPVFTVAETLLDPTSSLADREIAASRLNELLTNPSGTFHAENWNQTRWMQYGSILRHATQQALEVELRQRGNRVNYPLMLTLTRFLVDSLEREASIPQDQLSRVSFERDRTSAQTRLRGMQMLFARRTTPSDQDRQSVNNALARLEALQPVSAGLEESQEKWLWKDASNWQFLKGETAQQLVQSLSWRPGFQVALLESARDEQSATPLKFLPVAETQQLFESTPGDFLVAISRAGAIAVMNGSVLKNINPQVAQEVDQFENKAVDNVVMEPFPQQPTREERLTLMDLLAQVGSLVPEAFDFYIETGSQNQDYSLVARLLKQDTAGRYIPGPIVGLVVRSPAKPEEFQGAVHSWVMVMDRNWRSRGIGRVLAEASFQVVAQSAQAKDPSLYRVVWATLRQESKTDEQRFFERLGARQIKATALYIFYEMQVREKPTIPLTAGMEERAELEAAVQRDVAVIARILEETGVDGRVLLGLGPAELGSHGREVVDFLDRLKAQVASMNPLLVVTGDEAGRYVGRPSVLLASESLEGTVIALGSASNLYPVERIEYVATPDEAELLVTTLRQRKIPIAVVSHSLDSLPRILSQILRALSGTTLALSQSSVNEFYGIDLNHLAEQLQRLAQLGV